MTSGSVCCSSTFDPHQHVKEHPLEGLEGSPLRFQAKILANHLRHGQNSFYGLWSQFQQESLEWLRIPTARWITIPTLTPSKGTGLFTVAHLGGVAIFACAFLTSLQQILGHGAAKIVAQNWLRFPVGNPNPQRIGTRAPPFWWSERKKSAPLPVLLGQPPQAESQRRLGTDLFLFKALASAGP